MLISISNTSLASSSANEEPIDVVNVEKYNSSDDRHLKKFVTAPWLHNLFFQYVLAKQERMRLESPRWHYFLSVYHYIRFRIRHTFDFNILMLIVRSKILTSLLLRNDSVPTSLVELVFR